MTDEQPEATAVNVPSQPTAEPTQVVPPKPAPEPTQVVPNETAPEPTAVVSNETTPEPTEVVSKEPTEVVSNEATPEPTEVVFKEPEPADDKTVVEGNLPESPDEGKLPPVSKTPVVPVQRVPEIDADEPEATQAWVPDRTEVAPAGLGSATSIMPIIDVNEPEPATAMPVPVAPARRPRTGLLLTWAILATIVAVAALGLAGYEWGRKTPATVAVAPTVPPLATPTSAAPVAPPSPVTTPSAAVPSGAPSAPSLPSGSPAAPAALLPTDGTYTAAYDGPQLLTIQLPSACASVAYVDVDQPAAASDTAHADLTAGQSCTTLGAVFQFPGSVTAATSNTAVAGAADCAALIDTSPVAAGSSVDVTKGLTVCVATDPAAAAQQSISRKIAAVTVTAVTTTSISVTVSGWVIPSS